MGMLINCYVMLCLKRKNYVKKNYVIAVLVNKYYLVSWLELQKKITSEN